MLSTKTRSLGILFTATVLAVTGCSTDSEPESASQLPDEVQTQLQQVLDEVRADFNAPGMQAGVWTQDGEWVGTSGVAAEGTEEPITPDIHTRIGSITKTMTGTVVLQLIEEGQLSFDDVIDSYVPGMPNGDIVTIKDLVQLRSGIESYTRNDGFLDVYNADPTTVFTPQELVDFVKGTEPLFEPGAEFDYSNTNMVLLGMVIEQITGQSIPDAFQERLFDPLGMTTSSIPVSADLPSPYWSGITEQTDPEGEIKNATDWSPSFSSTAGDGISTLGDLRKWAFALGTGEGILSPEMQQTRVDSTGTIVPPLTNERAYGMAIGNNKGWLGHTGELPGYNTVVQYDPATDTVIVVMVNSDLPSQTLPPSANPAFTSFQKMAEVIGS